jgi:hypothetical protein
MTHGSAQARATNAHVDISGSYVGLPVSCLRMEINAWDLMTYRTNSIIDFTRRAVIVIQRDVVNRQRQLGIASH